jgi:hypothetical protein
MNTPVTFVPNVIKWDDDVERDEQDNMIRRDLAPGSACWVGNQSGDSHAALNFSCPCGCGVVHGVPVCRDVKVDGAWFWDGNVEKPTLTPSIQSLSACRWHGFLTSGVFMQC